MGRVTRLQALPIGPDAAQVSIYTIAPGLSNPPNPQLGPTSTTAVYILSCEPFESTYCTENEKSEWIFFAILRRHAPKVPTWVWFPQLAGRKRLFVFRLLQAA